MTAAASRRLLAPALLAVVLALLLAACGGADGPADDAGETEDTVSTPPGPDGPAATGDDQGAASAFTARLGGDARLEGGCAWLEPVDGDEAPQPTSGRYEPQWPDGYRVEFGPLRLVDPDGDVVAEEGDAVDVRGQVRDDVMTVCQVGPVFAVSEVRAAD